MTVDNQQSSFNFITPELTHRVELILHLLEYSNHLVIVKGEHESGKSTLCNELLQQTETNLVIKKLVVNTHTTSNDIFRAIMDEDQDRAESVVYTQADLNKLLERYQNKQKIPALLIDNVDLLSDELINELFEILIHANSIAVLHLCLFCDPSFLNRLKEPGINQEDERSLHIIEMPSLSEKQTEQYIHSKFPEGNTSSLNLFDDKTIKQIHRLSHGIPGRINALCEQYLDDPAKKTTTVEVKPTLNIKSILINNKLIIITATLLLVLSAGITALLYRTSGDQVATQTIKLNLPNMENQSSAETEVVKLNASFVAQVGGAIEPVTIEDLSPSVLPEYDSNKSQVTVYSAEGQVVAKESDLDITEPVKITETESQESAAEDELEKIAATTVEPEPEPEPKVEAKPIPKPTPKPVKKDINWLVKQDPKKYVLQLIGAYEKKTIELYLNSFDNDEDNIIGFDASNNDREWHVLVYGLYDNRDEAVAAIETLPTKAKLMAPWPRTVGSIKELLK